MDILTHTLSGAAVGGATAALTSKSLPKKTAMMVCGAVGAALPDMDTVTLWSRFDAVIGQLLGLTATGRSIYFGNLWYSHHNWTHSLMAGVAFTLLVAIMTYLYGAAISKRRSFHAFKRTKSSYLLAFFLGYGMHLLGDLPTPGHTWGGIKLLWPLQTPIGGSSHVWWWNNYDIFLLLAGCCAATALLMITQRFLKQPFLKYVPMMICALTILAGFYQITHRPNRFAYNSHRSNHAENEKQSLVIQKKILGDPLYGIMVNLDRRLFIHF